MVMGYFFLSLFVCLLGWLICSVSTLVRVTTSCCRFYENPNGGRRCWQREEKFSRITLCFQLRRFAEVLESLLLQSRLVNVGAPKRKEIRQFRKRLHFRCSSRVRASPRTLASQQTNNDDDDVFPLFAPCSIFSKITTGLLDSRDADCFRRKSNR